MKSDETPNPSRTVKAGRTRAFGHFEITIDDRLLTFRTQAGVFSQDGPDEGSRLLVDTILPRIKPHMRVLDLGTGVGFIGVCLASRATRGEIWMVDSDVRAVRLAEENVRANALTNTRIVLGDITLDLPPKLRFDVVVSNPPTHSGKEVLAGFVRESYHVLRPGGSLYIVVNRLLSVRSTMAEYFTNVEELARKKGFLVLHSTKPRREYPLSRESASNEEPDRELEE